MLEKICWLKGHETDRARERERERGGGGGGECNERHSFHARVGRFSPFLYLRSVALLYLWSVAIAVILFWLQLVVLVSPVFLGFPYSS